jgi:hypothetical protein
MTETEANTSARKFFRQFNVDQYHLDNMSLSSGSWSGGGSYGNCYDGSKSTHNAEKPLEFVEFDNLLIEICPNVSFLQYRSIKEQSCRIIEDGGDDYYGGSWTNFQHRCDLQKLYDAIVGLQLVDA